MKKEVPLVLPFTGNNSDPLFLQSTRKLPVKGVPDDYLPTIWADAHKHLVRAIEVCGAFWHSLAGTDKIKIGCPEASFYRLVFLRAGKSMPPDLEEKSHLLLAIGASSRQIAEIMDHFLNEMIKALSKAYPARD